MSKLNGFKKYKIVALINRDGKLTNGKLYKSIRSFYGLWLDFKHMPENSYENECHPYDLYIFEDDKYGYDEGDLVHTTNIPLETVKGIDKEYGKGQKGYEWLITVEANGNQYKPCEIFGKVVATTNEELGIKHDIHKIPDFMVEYFVKLGGNVDVTIGLDGELDLIPNEYVNSGKAIQLVNVTDRYDLNRDDYSVMNKAHITLGWNSETKGHDIVLKNRYGKNGTIYRLEDIEKIITNAFQAGVDYENTRHNDNDSETMDLKKYLKENRPTH